MSIGTSALLRIMRGSPIVQVIVALRLQPIISTSAALAELATRLRAQPRVGLDTEFLRERTYRAQLCLVQLSWADGSACVDPLALEDLGPLAQLLTAPAVKVMHASRQDLEVLLPVAGLTRPVFDTQIAAGLTGLPAQIGYAELVRRLLGHELAKSHTRTDWSRRPLSAEQLAYALDDVNYLLPLADRLQQELARLGRLAWLEEELQELADAGALSVDPEKAWQRLKGLRDLDPGRLRLARALAAWRERNAIEHDRPRGWILEESVLREIVLQVPRTLEALEAITEMPPGLVKRRGGELLACVAAADIPLPAPPLPGAFAPRSAQDCPAQEPRRRHADVSRASCIWRRRYWRRAAIWNCWPTVSATRRCCTAGAARCWGSACWRRSEARGQRRRPLAARLRARGRRAPGRGNGLGLRGGAFAAGRAAHALARTLGVAADAAGGLAHRPLGERALGARRAAQGRRAQRLGQAPRSRHPDRPRHR